MSPPPFRGRGVPSSDAHTWSPTAAAAGARKVNAIFMVFSFLKPNSFIASQPELDGYYYYYCSFSFFFFLQRGLPGINPSFEMAKSTAQIILGFPFIKMAVNGGQLMLG